MSALLKAELIKLRTTRTFAGLVGAALGLTLLLVGLRTSLGDGYTEREAAAVLAADFTSFFILLLGVIGTAGEWRHRTITGTVLAAPDRIRLMAAKVLAYAAAGALLSLIVSASSAAFGTAILAARGEATPDFGPLLDVIWRSLLVAALLGALGSCVGALLRNQLGAIVLLLFAFVVELTLIGLRPDIGRFGPVLGAPMGLQDSPYFSSGNIGGLEFLPSLATMFAWIGVLFAAAVATLRARDLV